MTEPWVPALIAAIGAITVAVIGVFGGRGRLHRLEVMSRILKDLPYEEPARASLAEVFKDDADELRRLRRSPEPTLLWLSAFTLILLFIATAWGDPIREWSPFAYIILVLASFVACFLLAVAFLAVAVSAVIRLIRSLIRRRRAPRGSKFDELPSNAE